MTQPAPKPNNLPPMLTQYQDYKRRYPDCFIFFQVGDFYEVFFDDAVQVAGALNVTLTSRDKNSDNPIPMCGVPVGVVDTYLDRLVSGGHSVAVISQISKPQAGKKMVDRELERVVTPAVRLFGTNADEDEEFLAAVYPLRPTEVAIAFSHVQSGVVQIQESLSIQQVASEIERLGVREVVLPSEVEGKDISRRLKWVKAIEQRLPGVILKFRSPSFATDAPGDRRKLTALSGYAGLGPAGRRSVRLLVNFLDETTVHTRLNIFSIERLSEEGTVKIDSTTRRNLELAQTLRDGTYEGSLLHFIDHAATAGGRRFLRSWLLHPLTSVSDIRDRQNVIELLTSGVNEINTCVDILRHLVDFERLAARIDLGIVSPRELGALRDSLERLPLIVEWLAAYRGGHLGVSADRLDALSEKIAVPEELYGDLAQTLVDAPPPSLSEGGIIQDGCNDQLDAYRDIRSNGKQWINELEAKERGATGIGSLKIRFNNVLGYFFEVTKANLEKVPEHYVRRQTMTNAHRFITDDLKQREEEILNARDRQVLLEKQLFEELRDRTSQYSAQLRELYSNVSELDAYISLSLLAEREDYVKPHIVDSDVLEICEGRHPVVSRLLEGGFIPNSLSFGENEKRCVILTGPNMGGKSTYLRQTALIVLLSQIGSFVPARSARIGVVDQIFARLGASDDPAEGESTFMVEMREASHILSHATERSLVLIDEIGRGTATADGLAIARAILEWILDRNKSRTLFATHFHELTDLEASYPTLLNLSVGSVDRDGEVVFTHEIKEGPANRSYGVEVARLAELPAPLLTRARELLAEMSRQNGESRQLSIFHDTPIQTAPERENVGDSDSALQELQKQIADLELDTVTPRNALQILYDLQDSLGRKESSDDWPGL